MSRRPGVTRREVIMDRLSPRRFGMAMGTSFALLYLLCAVGASIVPENVGIRFLTMIAHSIDWKSVTVWKFAWADVLCGTLAWLVMGWSMGALIAVLYNATGSRCCTPNAHSKS